MISLFGCGTALVTPFVNGEVDYNAYTSLVDRQVKSGVNFLVALATTGETPALSTDEKIRLLQITKEHSKGLPVVAGCGSNSVPGTLDNIRLLEPYGADAWLVVVPFYNKPTQEGMYRYFKIIADNSSKPVIIYNVPGRTGANMLPSTCLRLARDVRNIIAIKEASGKIEQVKEILKDSPDSFAVLSGDDDLTLEMMKYGARGVISVASNLVPSEISRMCRSALEARKEGKSWEEAETLDRKLNKLFGACFVESNPIPVKAGLDILGLCSKEMRLPLTEATQATSALMEELLKPNAR